ncbi:hypothetical protein C1H46_042549 [Malus baccata]|uniref:Aldehyde dehydrogenase domain-containing protein n=1 Tax=Malus baccata TaxID=106549 RepID=A0A540KCF5_MALBA|nr:hypothetical protein C1H46_042549 [Malus baccata]
MWKTIPTLDTKTGDVIAHAAEGDAEDVNRADSAAPKAFDEGPWPKMTAYERSRVLFLFADLNGKHSDEIAALETWDNGKPFEQAAEIEAKMLAPFFRYHAGMDVFYDTTTPYALACGNTIVLKTAEQKPLRLLDQLTLVKKNTRIGCQRQSEDGNRSLAGDPRLLYGQCCCAGSRTFVHEKVYDEFIEKARAHAERRVVGDPSKGGVEQASHAFPVLYSNHTDSEQLEKIPKYIDYGVKGGAKMEPEERGLAQRVSILSPLYYQMFSPVLPLEVRTNVTADCRDLNEVIRRENNSHYGLAAGVFTQNIDTETY